MIDEDGKWKLGDWQVATTFKALAEMSASGYSNYVPFCVRPILAEWMKETGYIPVYRGGNGDGSRKWTPIPKELR